MIPHNSRRKAAKKAGGTSMSKEKLSKEEKKAAKKDKKAAKKENRKNNPEVSATWIQCVSAFLCVAIVAFGANSITDKVVQNKKDIAGGTSGSVTSEAEIDAEFADFGGDVITDDGTGAVADDGTGAVADDGTGAAAGDTGTTGGSTTGGTTTGGSSSGSKSTGGTTTGGTTGGTAAKKSLTTADVLKIYNDATKKAADKKVAFTKSRTTTEKKYEAGLALSSFKSIVFKFMGVGDANKFSKAVTAEDADSYFKYFLASSLTASDITRVACKDNGNSYTIKIALKDGSSAVTGGKITQNSKTSLDKSGIACGEHDKDYWDHKTAENIYSAISAVPGCGSATIKESYSGAIVTMTVTKDGKITEFLADFNFHIDISGVMGSSGVAEASSSVVMKDFKW